MTPERKREIADEIITAFRTKGLLPVAGSYGDGETCACAISAVIPPGAPRIEMFARRYGVSNSFAWSVADGFDGRRASDLFKSDDWVHGYDIGRMVREAVFPKDADA